VQRSIAFFDFDGTITTKDTFLEIIRYTKGESRFAAGFALMSPWLIAMKMKLISNSDAKQRVMRHFFGGTPVDQFRQQCEDFVNKKLPALIRPGALRRIDEYRKQGAEIVVVSASPEFVVAPWCRVHQLSCIGTRLEVKDGLITGNIEGKNCYGPEKVVRIQEKFDVRLFGEVHAYGDSRGDKAMLDMATTAHYKPFR